MTTHQYRTLTKRIVDCLAVNDKDAVFRDRELPGFGLRAYPTGAKVYVVQTRCAGRSRRTIVGQHGDVSPDQARKEAARIIAHIKSGEEPIPVAPKADPTMADLAERYHREHVARRCRPATAVLRPRWRHDSTRSVSGIVGAVHFENSPQTMLLYDAASSVLRPRAHLTRYHGVFAPNFKHRRRIVPSPTRHSAREPHASRRAPMSWMQRPK